MHSFNGGVGSIQLSAAPTPTDYNALITTPSAQEMIRPAAAASTVTSRAADSGVQEGDVASYKVIQYLEKVGDDLTGDHQPSGAAVKEALREALHKALLAPLTRSQARQAYNKAITIVVTDSWHTLYSRTYGGRNSKAQIAADATDLFKAAVADFRKLEVSLKADGYGQADIQQLWDELHNARLEFFATGEIQGGSVQS